MLPPNAQPPQAPAPAEEEVPMPSEKGAAELITGIHSRLLRLKEVIGKVPQIPEPLKAQLESLIAGYKEFVGGLSKSLSGGAEAPAPQAPAPAAPQAPAGPMAPKGPIPATGGRGAVPVRY